MNFSLPAPLWSLHKRLIDDAGRINELPAGRWGDYYLTQAITHSRYAHVYGEPDLYYGYNNGWNHAAMPFVGAYKREIDNSWVVDKLPPIGSLIWQIKGDLLVCRTSKIANYYQGLIQAALEPAGPYAGAPAPGDSGSVCYVNVDGQWKVFGVVNSLGTCHAPFWTSDLPLANNQFIAKREGGIPSGAISQTDHYFGQQTITPYPMRLFLDKPPTSLRVVGRFTEGDDGTDNVVLDVLCGVKPETIEVEGANGDKWCNPDNKKNWIIRAVRLDESRIRLFLKESNTTNSYWVSIDGKASGAFKPIKPSFSEGPAVGQKPEEKPAKEFSDFDIIGLQAELVKLRKTNADMRVDLQNEQAKSASLQAELDRTAGMRLGLEMVAKEMGWGR
jgi:hypothetical protein